jgi:hypothetical protein
MDRFLTLLPVKSLNLATLNLSVARLFLSFPAEVDDTF